MEGTGRLEGILIDRTQWMVRGTWFSCIASFATFLGLVSSLIFASLKREKKKKKEKKGKEKKGKKDKEG